MVLLLHQVGRDEEEDPVPVVLHANQERRKTRYPFVSPGR